MSPPPDLANDHLIRARQAHGAGRDGEAVVWLHAAAEVAVARLSVVADVDTGPGHRERISAAYELASLGRIPDDAPALLVRLNDERKQFLHGGKDPDLRGRTWDAVFSVVEIMADAARQESSATLDS